jgi:hypothetical protein
MTHRAGLSIACLATKRPHSVDYLALLRTAHSGEKRKAQKPIGLVFGDGASALASTKTQTHWRQM